MNSADKQLNGVDLIKFIMAFCVVAIHVSTYSVSGGQHFPSIIQWLISLAVPYFFISSGYLICRKICNSKTELSSDKILRSRSKKLVKLYGYWLMIYLPIAFLFYYNERIPVSEAIMGYIRSILIDGESPYAWPLWFIYSMAISCFILSVFRFNNKNLIVFLIFFGIVILFNSFTYENKLLHILSTLTNRSLRGGVFIVSGMLFFLYRSRISESHTITALLLLTSLILFYLDLPFSDLTGGLGVFKLGESLVLKRSSLCQTLRQLSMWIYYTHMLILYPFIVYGKMTDQYFNIYLIFILSSAIVLIVSISLYNLQALPYFKWLKNLIR